ncbi:hypothetical protein ACHAWU_004341 [Discostella pseudostelligera]|uniref:RRM domain-containing protein n=1 Tax=Discostella pseudostelligera TaxID=259834 RepID=A0ABD3N4C2_9STRA
MTYNDIIQEGIPEGGSACLKSRLIRFRKWATKSAKITVHGALCIVNGEATDGTRNAPVLVFETARTTDPRTGGGGGGGSMSSLSVGGLNNHINSSSSASSSLGGGGGSSAGSSSEVRCGAIDNLSDQALYDRSIGCQVRTVRELKKDEIALSIPVSAMITPDLIALSDAGQAILACCSSSGSSSVEDTNNINFWNAFGVTSALEKVQFEKIAQSNGTQLLVKILQERKKVETALMKGEEIAMEVNERGDIDDINSMQPKKLAPLGSVSHRAPFLAFLIHQRFANEQSPPVAENNYLISEDVPETFAPYARTLPSSVCVPICWKRNELALLAGCIPGMPALQKVAARTMQLATELVALVDAGLMYRFPTIFTPGMITWDRWVWAAAVYESRVLSMSSLPSWIWSDATSPSRVWESCGVMVPFLDMLNHEDNAAQVCWKNATTAEADEDEASVKRLNLITNEKTKKHMQIYRNYGVLDNEQFMLQYGFTRMSNPADKVRIAWALVDGVGGVPPPKDYEQDGSVSIPVSQLVYESSDPDSLKAWWTEQRLALLGYTVQNNADTMELLKRGKKITFCAFNNGKIDHALLAVAVVATLPPAKVEEMHSKLSSSTPSKPLEGFVLDLVCQNTVQLYLRFLFSKKLEKLLQSLNSCLKDHFNSVQLWTKASMGGLNYVAESGDGAMSIDGGGGENSSTVVGWQSFFDSYVWYSTMEVEERYYSMAPDSCVLSLYDGHVRSLQTTLDIVATEAALNDNMKRLLEDLGCVIDSTASYPTLADMKPAGHPFVAVVTESVDDQVMSKNSGEEMKPQDPPKKDDQGNTGLGNNGQGNGNKRDRDRRKDKSKGDRPPAIKLHIGNLSYKTLPNQLYDFFTSLYGKGSVLECHIPTERDTGNSRGFGFVTMPENHAKAALESGRKHEMDGRILKVAESNSVGSGKAKQGGRNNMPPAPSSDRCSNCGYRPRWCTCNPNMMPMNMGRGGPPPPDYMYGMRPYMPPPMMGGGPGYGHPHDMDDRYMGGGDGHGWGGGGNFGGVGNRRSFSRSPSYRRERDRGHRRSRSYSRSRSRSYSRGRDRSDRHRDRGRHDDGRRRYDDDSRRGSSRRYRSKSRSRSRQRDSPVSPNRGRPNDDAGNFSDDPEAGRSLSRSLSPNDGNTMDRTSKKRDGKDASGRSDGRSRSRDHGSRRRKRSKGSRRGKESSKRRGGSRSRSRDRH